MNDDSLLHSPYGDFYYHNGIKKKKTKLMLLVERCVEKEINEFIHQVYVVEGKPILEISRMIDSPISTTKRMIEHLNLKKDIMKPC